MTETGFEFANPLIHGYSPAGMKYVTIVCDTVLALKKKKKLFSVTFQLFCLDFCPYQIKSNRIKNQNSYSIRF
jgi:hypothetical protein